jgi:hypothetical protein
VRRKWPELWENKTWLLHHDDVLAHVLLLVCSYLAKHKTSIVPHPPYYPDLVPADVFLFLKLKTNLKGHHFQTIAQWARILQKLAKIQFLQVQAINL